MFVVAAKLVLFTGLAGIAGYVGMTASKFDPDVYPYSKDQVETMLVNARTVMERRDGDGQIKIWSVGRIKQGVKLHMRYADADWAPTLKCRAVIEVVAPDKTRVTPDCNQDEESTSAIERTTQQLRVPMFAEHIQATLNNRAFNRDNVTAAESATVFVNMGDMQREALKRSDEAQQMSAAH